MFAVRRILPGRVGTGRNVGPAEKCSQPIQREASIVRRVGMVALEERGLHVDASTGNETAMQFGHHLSSVGAVLEHARTDHAGERSGPNRKPVSIPHQSDARHRRDVQVDDLGAQHLALRSDVQHRAFGERGQEALDAGLSPRCADERRVG